MLKNVLLIIAVSSATIGCSKIPPQPEIWQCAHDADGTGFYCVNTKTKEEKVLLDSSPEMHGAQCVSLEDYGKLQQYYDTLKELAEKNCR
jgi:hypothetical protein